MKVKSRIVRQTTVTLTEKDMERLSSEYGTLNGGSAVYRNSLPMIQMLVGSLLGDAISADFQEAPF